MSKILTIYYDTRAPQSIKVENLTLEHNISFCSCFVELAFSTDTLITGSNSSGIEESIIDWREIWYKENVDGKECYIKLTNKSYTPLYLASRSIDDTLNYEVRTEECEILPCIAENSKKGEPILSKIVYVRFASSSSIFKPNTKIYPYEIIDDELFNKLQIGSIIKIKKLSDNSYLTDVFDYSPSYRDTEIRVEGKVTVSKEDIPFIIDKKEWKIIKDIFYIRDSIDKKWITDFIQKQKEFIPVYAESSLTYSIGDSCITYTDIERERIY